MRNAISRRRETSVVAWNSVSSKIVASGWNEIVVPFSVARPELLHRPLRHAARELLAVGLAVELDRGDQPVGERVDDGCADAVQAAGDLVAVAAELAAGVQLGEDHLERGDAGARDLVDGDAAAAVDDRDRVVRVDRHRDRVVVARERLVDRVVDDLVDQVVEAADAGRADVHARPQPDRLEAFEHGDVLGRVTGLCLGLRHKGENACKTRVLRGTRSVSDRAGAAPLCKPQTDRFLHTFAQLFVSDHGGDRAGALLVLRRGLDRRSQRAPRRPRAAGPGAKRRRGTSQPAARRRSAISGAR